MILSVTYNSQTDSRRALWSLFLRMFVPLVLILISGVWFYGKQEIDHELVQLQNQEIMDLESAVPLYVRASDAELSLLQKSGCQYLFS